MSDWADRLPAVRGRLLRDEPLAPFTWFRVGGPAQALFLPEGEDDLAGFLAALDPAVPLTVLGVGSNTLVRDGGVEGVVVRLGRGFNEVAIEGGQITAGAAVPDAVLARKAAQGGVAELEFYAGIPGTVGGAVVMNAGCYGAETVQVLTSARVMDRRGQMRELSNAELGYSYRHSVLQDGEPMIVLSASFAGRPDDPAAIQARIGEITSRRETTQPIREKTGGSTFRNPPGHASWKLVDEAGWRGRLFGGAKFSELHANFLINTGEATAADLEGLGEAVRADVKARTGVQLEWEIKRIGRA